MNWTSFTGSWFYFICMFICPFILLHLLNKAWLFWVPISTYGFRVSSRFKVDFSQSFHILNSTSSWGYLHAFEFQYIYIFLILVARPVSISHMVEPHFREMACTGSKLRLVSPGNETVRDKAANLKSERACSVNLLEITVYYVSRGLKISNHNYTDA